MEIDVLVLLSNIAIVIVTAGAVITTVREGHRHEEAQNAVHEHEQHDLAMIVHEVLEAEKREHALPA